MPITLRVLVGCVAIYAAGLYFLVNFIVDDIRPRYLEAVEESLNDTAHLLASVVETSLGNGPVAAGPLREAFARAGRRTLDAQIYGMRKRGVGIGVYVTDRRGFVVYDSRDPSNIGRDFSAWRDVKLTLEGKYGARSTRNDKGDPSTTDLYVAAPITRNGRIEGVLTVIKPQDSVTPFMVLAKNKLVLAGFLTLAAFIVLALLMSLWVTRPLHRLTAYVRRLRSDPAARPPRLAGREVKRLGDAFEEVWAELAGRTYIENYLQALTHELKSPLASLRGAAELLGEDMPDEQRRRFAANILRESMRMEAVISRLLDLSSLENRRGLGSVEQLQLAALAREAAESAASAAGKKTVTIETAVPESLCVTGERFLISHAIINLVENAVRFSRPGGVIRITAVRFDGRVAITVRDDGEGMPPYALDRVFEKFYSLPDAASGRKGTGLGLSFAREAVALHGGSLVVRNNADGPGVSAVITLPL